MDKKRRKGSIGRNAFIYVGLTARVCPPLTTYKFGVSDSHDNLLL